MKQTQLRSKDVNKVVERFGVKVGKKDACRLVEDEYKVITVNGKPSFFYYEDSVVPTLQFLQSDLVLKKITVDMGAIKFVVNGADIMRPGIVAIEDGIAKDDFIVVIDEQNGKALAVGIALLGTEEIRSSTSGKVIRNIHYVGDDIWKQ